MGVLEKDNLHFGLLFSGEKIVPLADKDRGKYVELKT